MRYITTTILISFLFFACDDGEGAKTVKGRFTLHGGVDKGPFIEGSQIEVIKLDNQGFPTGVIFSTTTNTKGRFGIIVNETGYVEVVGAGFYFQEITGEYSNTRIELRALYEVRATGSQEVFVNIFTHLSYRRVKYLLLQGLSFDEALAQAETELRAELGLAHPDPENALPGTSMDVLGGDTDDNRYLLGLTCVLMQAAKNNTGSITIIDRETQRILNTIANDIEEDGALSEEMKARIRYAESTLAPAQCMGHLEAWTKEHSLDISIPNINYVVDTDGDGVPNALQSDPEMVSVPTGLFYMGTETHHQYDFYAPGHLVFLSGYKIDRFEVSLSDYLDCVEASGCLWPSYVDDTNRDKCNFFSEDRLNHPINCISVTDAETYCAWADKRLPTEAEWEKAARGGCELYSDCRLETPTYPWGETFPTAELANYNPTMGGGSTLPVGSLPSGVSPYGAFDMAGNVWEWTADRYDDAGYFIASPVNPLYVEGGNRYSARGGSYGFRPIASYDRSNDEFFLSVLRKPWELGFRCAKNHPEACDSPEDCPEPPIGVLVGCLDNVCVYSEDAGHCLDNIYCTDSPCSSATCGQDGICGELAINSDCCMDEEACSYDPCIVRTCDLASRTCQYRSFISGCCSDFTGCNMSQNVCVETHCDFDNNVCVNVQIEDCCRNNHDCETDDNICTQPNCEDNTCQWVQGCCLSETDCSEEAPCCVENVCTAEEVPGEGCPVIED